MKKLVVFALLLNAALVARHPRGAVAQENPPIRNLGAGEAVLEGDWLAYSVSETFPGEDLNGDGDTSDRVVHVHRLSTGETTNLGLAAAGEHSVSGDWLVFEVSESDQGQDVNGDGDRDDNVVQVHRLSTGETRNLGLATWPWPVPGWLWSVSGDWLVFSVSERDQGQDLNGDGDTGDWVVHVHRLSAGETRNLGVVPWWLFLDWQTRPASDLIVSGDWLVFPDEHAVVHVHRLSTGETTNLGLAADRDVLDPPTLIVSGNWLVFPVPEARQGEDLDGDGDTEDVVFHVHRLSTGETTNLGLAGRAYDAWTASVSGDWLVFEVVESDQGQDLNGDGDRDDYVVHVHRLSTGETTNLGFAGWRDLSVSGDWLVFVVSEGGQGQDLNGDGDRDDSVVHVYRFSTGETTNLRLAGLPWGVIFISGDWLVVRVPEPGQRQDLNGDGDSLDIVAHLVDLTRLDELRPSFRRGDCNDDGSVDLSDAVRDLRFCFTDTAVPCAAACDTDGDGDPCTGVTDGVRLLMYLFRDGAPPPPPFPECGTVEGLVDCESLPVNCQ